MKANELRIGNFVKRLGIVVKCDYMSIPNCHAIPEQYEPIKITPEWLIKLGFKPKNQDTPVYFIKDELFFSIDLYSEFVYCHEELLIKMPLYVHQLQNLYFALTGKELKSN